MVKWLRHRPFKAVTGVRIPLGSPKLGSTANIGAPLLFIPCLVLSKGGRGLCKGEEKTEMGRKFIVVFAREIKGYCCISR